MPKICVKIGVGGSVGSGKTALVDVSMYVIDVSGGDKIPRKGGPGVTRSDLLVMNKIDLAPAIGADLEVMRRDAQKMRDTRPFVFTNLKSGAGVPAVIAWLERDVLFIPTATLLEHALLTQGFMGGSKAGFLHILQPQNRDSTRANLANTQK